MKIIIKIILVILIIVFIVLVGSWYSKYNLSHNAVFSELNFDKSDCYYQGGTRFGDTPHSASFICLTKNRYKPNSDAQKAAIGDMRNILEKNGWVFSPTESFMFWDLIYHKGQRTIHIYPDEEQGYSEFKLIVSLK